MRDKKYWEGLLNIDKLINNMKYKCIIYFFQELTRVFLWAYSQHYFMNAADIRRHVLSEEEVPN